MKIRARETFHPDREKHGDELVLPQLSQGDIQSFIASFRAMKSAEKKPENTLMNVEPEPHRQNQELIALRTEYEAKLRAKDTEIQKRDEIIEQIEESSVECLTALPDCCRAHQQAMSICGWKNWGTTVRLGY